MLSTNSFLVSTQASTFTWAPGTSYKVTATFCLIPSVSALNWHWRTLCGSAKHFAAHSSRVQAYFCALPFSPSAHSLCNKIRNAVTACLQVWKWLDCVCCTEASSTYAFYSSSKVILEWVSNCISRLSLASLFFMTVSLATISPRLWNAWLCFSRTLEPFPFFFACLCPQVRIWMI